MSTCKILVVDDDKNLLELIKMRLESSDYDVTATPDEDAAKNALKGQAFDLAVVDLQLVNQCGISLMEELHLVSPDMPVMILTAHGSIDSAVDAMKRGAYTYLTKPFEAADLIIQIERALESRKLSGEINRLRELFNERYEFDNIIARSEEMREVLELVLRIAPTDSTVFIHGESGTGKELIARALHLASGRNDKSFVAVNCAAIPEALLESELFGYEKGAFTGAMKNSRGLFSRAHEGTIFLDEIGDMSLQIQAKFLRVLQERQFYPLGSERPVEVDVRVLVATNKNLEEEVSQGRFREDLFYRIYVIPIEIPPLRGRKHDIPLLAEYFIQKYGKETGKDIKGLAPLAMQKLMSYEWPGNVRELENIIEYAVALTQKDVITEDLILPAKVITPEEPVKPMKDARSEFERSYLIKLLKLTNGNVSSAAKLAKKYRADFYNLINKYGIFPKDFKD